VLELLGEGSPLASPRVGEVYDLSQWLVKLPGVTAVRSLLDLSPDMSARTISGCVEDPAGHVACRRCKRPYPDGRGAHHGPWRVSTSHSPAATRRAPSSSQFALHTRPWTARFLITGGHRPFDLDFMGVRASASAVRLIALVGRGHATRRSFSSWARVFCPSRPSSSTCCPSAPPTVPSWIFQDGISPALARLHARVDASWSHAHSSCSGLIFGLSHWTGGTRCCS